MPAYLHSIRVRRLRLNRALACLALLGAGLAPPALADEGSVIGRMLGLGTTGSGNVQVESRVVSGFQAVTVSGSINVVLRQGNREGVEVSADNNLLPLIETRVENGTLRIRPKAGASYSTHNPVLVSVDLIALKSLSVGGSGEVSARGLKADKIDVTIGGSGSVKFADLQTRTLELAIGGSGSFSAKGRADKLDVSVGGSGGVLTDALDADDVSIAIGGSGGAVVKANRSLDVAIAGSGSVVYSGEAVLSKSIAGSGRVMKR